MRFNSPLIAPRWFNSFEAVAKVNPGQAREVQAGFVAALQRVLSLEFCGENDGGVRAELEEVRSGSAALRFETLAKIDALIELPGDVLRVAAYFDRPNLGLQILDKGSAGADLDFGGAGAGQVIDAEVLGLFDYCERFDFFGLDADCDGLILDLKGTFEVIFEFLSKNAVLISNLKSLNLSGNVFSREESLKLVNLLKNFTALKELSFEDIPLLRTVVLKLWNLNMPNLEFLNLRGTGLRDAVLEIFSRKNKLSNLRQVILGGNNFSSGELKKFFTANRGRFWSDVFLPAEALLLKESVILQDEVVPAEFGFSAVDEDNEFNGQGFDVSVGVGTL